MLLGVFVFIETSSFTYAVVVTILAILLIQIVRFHMVWNKNEWIKKSGIEDIDRMDGLEFEKYTAQLFKAHGFKVRVSQASGDFGADLVLKKNGVKTVVQAKRYSDTVGLSAVQEVLGAVNYYKANKAMVITNNYYTKPAIRLANVNNVQLIDRDQLIQMSAKVNDKIHVMKSNNTTPQQ